MLVYKYTVRDLSGGLKEGFKQAASVNDVLCWLGEQGVTPISVKEIAGGAKKTPVASRRKRIKSADLSMLCWQLTTMIKGGISITGALEAIGKDTESLQLQHVITGVLKRLKKGKTFFESVSEFPKVFNSLFCAMILAGETSGSLPMVLHLLAKYFEDRDKLAKKIKKAVAYPAFVFTFTILMVVFIMVFIIPQFRDTFDQFGGQLPAFTKAFIGFYDIVRYNLIDISFFLLLIIFAVITFSKTRKGHNLLCRLVIKLPLFGKLIRHTFIILFSKTMAMLLSAGVPVLEVVDILSSISNNDVIKAAIIRTKEEIISGSKISLSLAASGFFPSMVITMVQAGEESGSLCEILENTTEYYERKVDSTILTTLALLEPIMIVLVGMIVLIVVLALYMPIFSMSETIT